MDRLARFSDAVFALALGLLALRIPLPEPWVRTADLHDALGDVALETFGFALSAVVIAGFWIDHHRLFDRVERRTDALLWLNLAVLLCVAFIPFPGAVLGHHAGAPLAALFFAGAVAVTGVAAWALCAYVRDRAAAWRQLAVPAVVVATTPAAPVVVSIRGTEVSLAPMIWIVAVAVTRVLLERSAADRGS